VNPTQSLDKVKADITLLCGVLDWELIGLNSANAKINLV